MTRHYPDKPQGISKQWLWSLHRIWDREGETVERSGSADW